MSTNGPDDKMGAGETVAAVLIRADGKKTVIEEKRGLKRVINAFMRRIEPLFTRF